MTAILKSALRVMRMVRDGAGGDDVVVYLHQHELSGPFAVMVSIDYWLSLCERADVSEGEDMRHTHVDGECEVYDTATQRRAWAAE